MKKLMKLLSPAKVNLGLQVLNRRTDGYHNINTIFYPINIFDQLEFLESDSIDVRTSGLDINKEDNIVYKAAIKLQKKIGTTKGVLIKLEKNLPTGAGLGAGSANAAITLLALKSFWKSDIQNSELKIIAQALGSDVPFFLRKGAALGSSRGERLEYLAWQSKYKIVVVNPGIHISTPAAYNALNRDGTPQKPIDFRQILYRSDENPQLLNMLVNDFEKYALAEYPEIKEIKDTFYGNGAIFSMMSGSGSSVFAFFDKDTDLSQLKSRFGDYRVMFEQELLISQPSE